MAELPPHMGMDTFAPQTYGQASAEQRFTPRPVTMEDAIAKQMDRIAFLRSTGQPWAEAVYQLRDMVVGLEDDEFWDGMPDEVRELVLKLENGEGKEDLQKRADKVKAKRLREKWFVEGWEGYPCDAVRGPGGRPIYKPSSENLSCALRIVMRLLARRGIAWRTRRVSRLSEWEPNEAPGEGHSEAQGEI